MICELFSELGEELAPVRADVIRGEHARASLAMLRQQQIAEAEARIERAHVEGLGELQMRVDANVYFSMQMLFGRECWQDDGFRSDMLKKNPGMRIKSRSRKTTLRMPGFRNASADARTGLIVAP